MLSLLNMKFNIKTNNIGEFIDKDGKKWFFYHPIIKIDSMGDVMNHPSYAIIFKRKVNSIMDEIVNNYSDFFHTYAIFNGTLFLFISNIIFLFENKFSEYDILHQCKSFFNKLETDTINNILYTRNLFTYFGYSNKTKRAIVPIQFQNISTMSYQKLLEFNTIRKVFKPKQARSFLINDFYKIKTVKKVIK